MQNASCALKPVPATPTARPCSTLAGFSTTKADGVPTVKTADAFEPVLSPTSIAYVPARAVEGTMTEPETWPNGSMAQLGWTVDPLNVGITVALHFVASDSKPVPV